MTRVFVAWLLMQGFEVRALSRNPPWYSTFAFVTTCPTCANDFAGTVWCETPNAATVVATLASSSFSQCVQMFLVIFVTRNLCLLLPFCGPTSSVLW